MATTRSLKSFSLLSFDCFGTLIDWESGIFNALAPLRDSLSASDPLKEDRIALLKQFTHLEARLQDENPSLDYDKVLAAAYGELAKDLHIPDISDEEQARFGASIGKWPAFPDTVAALNRLAKHYKLVILSNVDRASFQNTLSGPLNGVHFDAIYTAQDIGSYKPDLCNFDYLIRHCEDDLGVHKNEILKTAQSLYHDHVPAKKVGLASCWIERGEPFPNAMGGSLDDYGDRVAPSFKFRTLGDMADAVDKAAECA